GARIRVGPASLGFPFPAPTGIVDYQLRSAGSARLVSTVTSASALGDLDAELDLQLPVAPTLTLAGGASFQRIVDQPRRDRADLYSVALAPLWQPAAGISLRPFFGRIEDPRDVTSPLI